MLKMVISYSIFLLVILLLFYVIYQFSINNMRNSYNFQNENNLINNAELFETDLHIMEVYCRQLLQNTSFRKIMNKETADTAFIETCTSVQSTLATDIYLESLLPVKEAFCYFPLTNYVLCPGALTTMERYYEWILAYPPEQKAQWYSYHTESEYHNRFLLLEDYSQLPIGDSEKDYYIYIINLNDLYYVDANATVSFLMKTEQLTQLFDCIDSDNNGFLLVTDEDGTPILSINEKNAYQEDSIVSLDFSRHFADYEIDGHEATIGKYVSSTTGYSYFYSFPSFEATARTDYLRTIFSVTFLTALVIGGMLVFHFSRRNIRPIIELGQELHNAVEAQNHLQEVMDSQRPIICTSYVRQLMSGTITSEEEVDYIRNYLRIDPNSHYNVLYVVVYNNFEGSTDTLPHGLASPEELQIVIENALHSFLGSPCYYFSPSERTYSILLTCDASQEKDFILKISNIILRLHDFMLDTYDIWLFAGIGKTTDSLMNVWESCQQATEAVSYTSKNYIFFPYEFIKKNSNVFYYPPEISTKLIHFISTGNTAQVLELFNLIHQENIEERSLPINLLKYLLSDIRNTLLKARFALPSDADPEAVKKLDEHFNEHLSFKLCEDIALNLCHLFTKEADDTNLAATIEKYIAKNYKDPSLGLNKISDEFQISESYFSHMFKEKTGVNFSTYLENIRMAEAVRLIRETDIGLNELYIAVGYNNVNTFRRAFKKVYGVTPSSMRESAK